MKRTFSIGLVLTTFLLFNSCDTPLNEYKPTGGGMDQSAFDRKYRSLISLTRCLIFIDARRYGLKAGVRLRRYHQGILTAGILTRNHSMGI